MDNEFEAIRRLAVTLGVSSPESNDQIFSVSFINSLHRAAKRNIKSLGYGIEREEGMSVAIGHLQDQLKKLTQK